ncbi:3-alpha-hydroxysteroid sulfotransferase-like [Ictidomys tridecemlineatus]
MTSDYLWFEGIGFPVIGYSYEVLKEACAQFVIKDEDTVLVNYPKSVSYGSWFEHIRGWMSMRDRENVLLLSYEELKKDPRSTIERICQFLGKKLNPEELDSVLKNSSFQVMKQNKMSNFEMLPESLFTGPFLITRKDCVVMRIWRSVISRQMRERSICHLSGTVVADRAQMCMMITRIAGFEVAHTMHTA